jgi:hypothetical protein
MMAVRIGLALLVALAFTVVPWLARQVSSRLLLIGLGGGAVLAILGSVFAVAPYPWTDLVVVLVAVTGGLLLGRVMPLLFWPFLCLLLGLSVVDVVLIVSTYNTTPPPGQLTGAALYATLLLMLPVGAVGVEILDLIVLTALAEHWRRRGAPWWVVLSPGVLGLGIAYAFLLVTKVHTLPFFPFLTVGWVLSGILYQYQASRRPNASV